MGNNCLSPFFSTVKNANIFATYSKLLFEDKISALFPQRCLIPSFCKGQTWWWNSPQLHTYESDASLLMVSRSVGAYCLSYMIQWKRCKLFYIFHLHYSSWPPSRSLVYCWHGLSLRCLMQNHYKGSGVAYHDTWRLALFRT